MRYLIPCAAAALAALGGSAVQTDWSEGPGSLGTVLQWSDCFEAGENVSWLAVEGQVCLSSVPFTMGVEEVVDESLALAGIASADLNGDGQTDIVGASLVSGHVWWFENLGDGDWESHELTGDFEGGLGCSCFDVDGDGYQDILGAVCEPDMVVAWLNNSGTGDFQAPVVIDSLLPGAHIAVGCFVDGDTFADVFAAGNTSHDLRVYYGSSEGTWESHVIDGGFHGTQSVSPGDIDGDGDIDAVAAALQDGQFAWWENPGNRVDPWQKRVVADSMAGAHHTVAVDMDLDGDLDVLGASFSVSNISWWENDGSSPPNWERHTVAPSLAGALTGIPCDLDGDNDIDVAGASWVADRILWYENLDGEGLDWEPRTVCLGFNGAWPLTSGDFDGNGRLDLAAGADVLNGPGVSHGISLFDLGEFTQEGWVESCVLDTQESPMWSAFEFEGTSQGAGMLTFKWRSSDDPADLGQWSEPYYAPSSMSGDINRYVQYRIEMDSGEGSFSPVVNEVSLSWDPQGASAGESQGPLFEPVTSPCRGGFVLRLSRSTGIADVDVRDISGRTVRRFVECAGGETVPVRDLAAGVYLVSAASGNVRATQRVAVLR